jgi:hypothetical protein
MFIEALDAAEASEIQNKKIADQALAKFRQKHADFDTLFPHGYEIVIGDGVTEKDVTDLVAKQYRYEKRRKEFHDQVRAQNAAMRDLVLAGWRPPTQPKVEARRRMTKQPDGSVIVDELDTD